MAENGSCCHYGSGEAADWLALFFGRLDEFLCQKLHDVNNNDRIYADDFVFWLSTEALCFILLSFSVIASTSPHCVHAVAHEEASQVSETGRK